MDDLKNRISEVINEAISIKQSVLNDTALVNEIITVANECIEAFKRGNKVLFCGNGGSAADAQHIAAELSGRFAFDREPLFAEALHVNTSYLTAVANDYSYDEVYSRLVKAKGKQNDILFAISTSGNSPNILKALETANALKMITVGMTGKTGGAMKDKCQYLINVPSTQTPRIQEVHIMIGHIVCEAVENNLFPKK